MIGKEIWKPIKDFPDYEVSNQGRIRSYKICRAQRYLPHSFYGNDGKPKLMMGHYTGDYPAVMLSRKNEKPVIHFIHLLVLEAFIGPRPLGCEAHHKNGTKKDSKLENLAWVSRYENRKHAIEMGLMRFDSACNPFSKLSWDDVTSIRSLKLSGMRGVDIAVKFGIDPSNVCSIINWKSWNLKGVVA